MAEEGRGENEVVQPVNPAANAAANAPANPAANAPANPAANAPANEPKAQRRSSTSSNLGQSGRRKPTSPHKRRSG
jgi:hypothetical protein